MAKVTKTEYYEPWIQDVKLKLRSKGISWKKAVSNFGVDEMITWFQTGNMIDRVVDAVVLRIKDNKKEN